MNGIACLGADLPADRARVRLRGARAGRREGQGGAARALASAAARARFGADVTRTHTSPLVGRELEKSLLIGTFERSPEQRSCQLVTIVGEPGVGKSRLVRRALRRTSRSGPSSLPGARAAACPTGRGSPSGRSERSSRPSAASSSRTRPRRPRPSSSARFPQTIPTAPGSRRGWRRSWARRRAGLAGGVVHGLAPLPGVAGREGARRCSSSRTCTGPTTPCSPSSSTSPTGRRACRCSCSAPPARSCYEQHPTWAAGLRNATTINLAPLTDEETARLISVAARAGGAAGGDAAGAARAGGRQPLVRGGVRAPARRPGAARRGGRGRSPDSVQALIAARLDTLSPERKSLLQDAAVVGKVFWAGAVAEMGGRDPREVEQALHELSRKELVRPARTTSSMEGEAEYGFWHLLVRDVCYAPDPPRGPCRPPPSGRSLDRGQGRRAGGGPGRRARRTTT